MAPEPSRPSLVPVLPFLVKPVPSAENAALLEKPSLIIPHDDDKDPLAGGVDSTSEVWKPTVILRPEDPPTGQQVDAILAQIDGKNNLSSSSRDSPRQPAGKPLLKKMSISPKSLLASLSFNER